MNKLETPLPLDAHSNKVLALQIGFQASAKKSKDKKNVVVELLKRKREALKQKLEILRRKRETLKTENQILEDILKQHGKLLKNSLPDPLNK